MVALVGVAVSYERGTPGGAVRELNSFNIDAQSDETLLVSLFLTTGVPRSLETAPP